MNWFDYIMNYASQSGSFHTGSYSFGSFGSFGGSYRFGSFGSYSFGSFGGSYSFGSYRFGSFGSFSGSFGSYNLGSFSWKDFLDLPEVIRNEPLNMFGYGLDLV